MVSYILINSSLYFLYKMKANVGCGPEKHLDMYVTLNINSLIDLSDAGHELLIIYIFIYLFKHPVESSSPEIFLLKGARTQGSNLQM